MMMMGGYSTLIPEPQSDPYSRDPADRTASVVAQWPSPCPYCEGAQGPHSQTMSGWKWLPTNVIKATQNKATPLFEGIIMKTTVDKPTRAHTAPNMQPCSPCQHPAAPGDLLGLMYDQSCIKRRATSHAGTQRQQLLAQHRHCTGTCECTTANHSCCSSCAHARCTNTQGGPSG